MKSKKIKIKIKNYQSDITKYLSRLNNVNENSDKHLYIINSLQQIIRFFNDYVIDSEIDSEIPSEILENFNQKAINTREHLYNLLYFEDSCDIIKEQTENILEYFFPKQSEEYFLLKNKFVINYYYMYTNIGMQYFLQDS